MARDRRASDRPLRRTVAVFRDALGDLLDNVHEAYLASGAIGMGAWALAMLVYDASALAAPATLAAAGAAACGVGVVVARRGYLAAATVLALAIPLGVAGLFAFVFSRETGFQFVLLHGSATAIAFISESRRALRIGVALANISVFAAAQLWATMDAAWYTFPPDIEGYLSAANAITVAVILYMLVAVVHRREARAQAVAQLAAEHASELARTDPLTGLANRRPALDRLADAATRGTRFAVAIVDFDHFKVLNDEYGHGCGDRVLATIGHELARNVRANDLVARWGGEEFIVVLPGADLGEATRLMERLRAAVDRVEVFCPQHTHHVTVSVGVGAGTPNPEDAIRRADRALYDAKAGGRNQVRVRSVEETV